MKKIILLTLIVVAFIGCSKDDPEEKFSLNGKRYVYSPMTVKADGQFLYYVYLFVSDTKVEEQVRKGSSTGGLFSEIKTNSYSLNYPYLIIKEADGSEFTYTFVTESIFRSDFNSTEYNLDN